MSKFLQTSILVKTKRWTRRLDEHAGSAAELFVSFGRLGELQTPWFDA